MDDAVRVRLQQIRLRKLDCQRHIRILTQKLASNPHDLWTRKELERLEDLLSKLEEQERQLAGKKGGEEDEKSESENSGSR